MISDKHIEDAVSKENLIVQSVIDGLTKPVFVTIQNEQVIDYIFEYCKNLLSYSMNRHGSKEMAYAINLNTLDFVGAEFGTSNSVDISSLIDKMGDSECIFIVLHNHPSNGPFSPRDLSTFFNIPNLAILMVIGNKGAIYTIEKTDKRVLDDSFKAIKKILFQYRRGNLSFEDVVEELGQYGIAYNRV